MPQNSLRRLSANARAHLRAHTRTDRDAYSKTRCYDDDVILGKETRPTPSSLRVQFLERPDPDRRRQDDA
jgi:hypothetical protein